MADDRTPRSWPDLTRPPSVATPRAVASVLAVFYLTAAACGLLASVLSHHLSGANLTAVRVSSGLALALAIGTLISWNRLGRWSYHALVATASLLIAVVIESADRGAMVLIYGFFYAYVVIACAFFFSVIDGAAQMVITVATSIWALIQLGAPWPSPLVAQVVFIVMFGVVAWLSQLADRAEIDPLTSLGNRRATEHRLQDAVGRAQRDGTPLTVVLLDLDHFKSVNDTRGHAAGDDLLVACAKAWRSTCPDARMLARHGGDEFAMVLPGYTAGQAADIADKLRRATPTGVTASAGVATWEPGDTASVLLSRADVALYEAKTQGRNRSEMYGDTSTSPATSSLPSPEASW